jgi:hypothetical protein
VSTRSFALFLLGIVIAGAAVCISNGSPWAVYASSLGVFAGVMAGAIDSHR